MKIVITGAQSTGKSTLLNKIKLHKDTEKYLTNYVFCDELTRKIQQQGIVINEDGDNFTQLLTLNIHLTNITNTHFISDRCILDAAVYTKWLHNKDKIDTWVLDYSINLLQTLVNKYDYIFYLPNEIPIEDDGVRSSSESFRNDIVNIFEQYINTYNIPVITLSGTVQKRLQTFYTTIL